MREIPEMNTLFFDSVAECGQYVKNNSLVMQDSGKFKWYGEINAAKSLELAITGDDSCVAQAERLMDKFSNDQETLKAKTVSDVVGGFASVPAFLSGNPQSMRRRQKVKNDVAPLTILVDLTCSCDIDAEKMRNRGIAILALVMLLTSSRPVELYAIGTGGAEESNKQDKGDEFHMIITRIETTPLDLATSAYALTHVGFFRRVVLGIGMKKYMSHGKWGTFIDCDYGKTTGKKYRETMLRHAGLPDETLYIPPASSYDRDSTMLMDEPIKWVNKMVKELATSEEI